MGFFRPPPLVYRQLLVLTPDYPVPTGFFPDIEVDVTSHSTTIGQQLSPFLLGPVPVPDGPDAHNVENLWQFAKCYPEHWDYERGRPLPEWWAWRDRGFDDPSPKRYPMGKGARPVCTWWDGVALDRIAARQRLYRTSYLRCAVRTGAWRWLLRELRRGRRILMRDFDAFDHVVAGVPFDEALCDPVRPFGHGMILAAELERQLAQATHSP